MSARIVCCLLAFTTAFSFLCKPTFAQPVGARVLSTQGTVEREQPPWVPAVVNTQLGIGSRIRTGDQSRAVLLLADETQLKINANSELQLTSVRDAGSLARRIALSAARSQESVLSLSKGQVWLRARNKPADVKVATPAVTAAIRGTEFDLRVADDGESVITVLEGAVDFRNDFGAVLVNTGEQGRARVGEAPTKTVLVNPADAVQWTLVYSGAISPRDYPFRYATITAARAAVPTAADPIGRAEALHDSGDVSGALDALSGATGPQAAEMRGWILLELNRVTEALRELEAAPATSLRARLGRSVADYRLGRFSDAYREAEPLDTRLTIQRAQLDLVSGDAAAARTVLESVAASDAAYSQARALLSNVYLVQDRKDAARAAAGDAVNAAPDSPTAWLATSLVEQSAFDLPAATRAATRALALDPSFLQAEIQYANLLFGAGETGAAEQRVRRVLTAAPDEATAHTTLGFILLSQGKNAEAATSLTRSLSLDTAQGEPHLGLGILAMREGRNDDATEEFLAAAALEPRRSLYQTYLAKALYELRRFDHSFAALQSAEALDPRDPTPHLYAGIYDNDLLRPGAAVREFEQSIALNDGRAVYRSRFLLDEDLATRNVNLASAYVTLGLSDWANKHALDSQDADQGDSASHLFLAETFSNIDGLLSASGGELLLARLLMRPNANSFNALNSYTTLFDKPQTHWTVDTSGGSFDSGYASANAYGGSRRLSYSSVWSYNRTNGFRLTNDDRHDVNGGNLVKFALTPHSSLLLTYVRYDSRQGDHGAGLSSFVSEADNDPFRRTTTVVDRGEVGFHQQLRPGSDFVAYVSGEADRLGSDNPKDLNGLLHTSVATRTPHVSIQAAHLLKLWRAQLRYGVDVYQGRDRSVTTSNAILSEDPHEEIPYSSDASTTTEQFRTVFSQATVPITRRISVVGALNYDWANHANFFLDDAQTTSKWNPSAGALWRVSSSTTLRTAAMRVLQTHYVDRLAPTQIEGFPLEQNEVSLALSTVYNVGLDQRLGQSTFVRATAFHRHRDIPGGSYCDLVACSNGFKGGEVVVDRLLTDKWTIVPGVSTANVTDLFGSRRDRQAFIGTYYVHPSGWSASVKEHFLDQHGVSTDRANDVSVFTTNAALSYELPRKRGLLALTVNNLTDRHYTFLADPLSLDSRIPRREVTASLRVNF